MSTIRPTSGTCANPTDQAPSSTSTKCIRLSQSSPQRCPNLKSTSTLPASQTSPSTPFRQKLRSTSTGRKRIRRGKGARSRSWTSREIRSMCLLEGSLDRGLWIIRAAAGSPSNQSTRNTGPARSPISTRGTSAISAPNSSSTPQACHSAATTFGRRRSRRRKIRAFQTSRC